MRAVHRQDYSVLRRYLWYQGRLESLREAIQVCKHKFPSDPILIYLKLAFFRLLLWLARMGHPIQSSHATIPGGEILCVHILYNMYISCPTCTWLMPVSSVNQHLPMGSFAYVSCLKAPLIPAPSNVLCIGRRLQAETSSTSASFASYLELLKQSLILREPVSFTQSLNSRADVLTDSC